MDAFDFDSVKAEKASAILQFHNFKSIAKLFRIVELCLGIVFLSWTTTRLPLAVRISGEYFRQLTTIIISPLFIFLICNIIILALLLKAGHVLSSGPSSSTISETDLYEGFIKTSENCTSFTNVIPSPVPEPVEIVYQDKQTIFEVSKNSETVEVAETGTRYNASENLKTYRRSQSEDLNLNAEFVEEEESTRKLRRSETEKCRKVANPEEVPEETVYIFDELSNEEFQRTIEEFIAKQIKFHQEEKLAIVLHSQT